MGIVRKITKHLDSIDFSELDKVAVAKELINTLQIDNSTMSLYEPFKELFIAINKLQK